MAVAAVLVASGHIAPSSGMAWRLGGMAFGVCLMAGIAGLAAQGFMAGIAVAVCRIAPRGDVISGLDASVAGVVLVTNGTGLAA